MQGSELEFSLCSVRNWIASFADLLLLAYRWTSFCAVSGLDPPKGARRHLSTDCHLFPYRWTPFVCRERPGSSAQTFTFFLVLDPFLCRERPGSSKKGCNGTATFSCCLDPFLCRERLGSSEKGSCDLASNLLLGPPFQQPYHTETLYLC